MLAGATPSGVGDRALRLPLRPYFPPPFCRRPRGGVPICNGLGGVRLATAAPTALTAPGRDGTVRRMSLVPRYCPKCGGGLRSMDAEHLFGCPPRRPAFDLSELPELAPIPMVLTCPRCRLLHVDTPEPSTGWTNPPHRSHKCSGCGCIWRPSDLCTTGVASIATRGQADTWPPKCAECGDEGVVDVSPFDVLPGPPPDMRLAPCPACSARPGGPR